MGKTLKQCLIYVESQHWDAWVFLPALSALWVLVPICTWIEVDKPQPFHGTPPASQIGCSVEWLILRNKLFPAVWDNTAVAILTLVSENSEWNTWGSSVDSTFSTFPIRRLLISIHPPNFMPGPLSEHLCLQCLLPGIPAPSKSAFIIILLKAPKIL